MNTTVFQPIPGRATAEAEERPAPIVGQYGLNAAIKLVAKQRAELCCEKQTSVEADEVLIQATRSLISTGTEMICFNGAYDVGTHWDDWVKYPFSMGYLLAGRVADVGRGVNGFAVGDRVATRRSHAKFAVAKAVDVVKIPDGVTDEQAAWMGLGKIVQVGVRAARHVMGDTVAVIGLGLLGQLAVQYVRLMGASQIIAIDTATKRLEIASQHGATTLLQMSAGEAKAEVLRLTGRGVDVAYDITGHPEAFGGALAMVKKQGTVVLLGDAGSPSSQRLTSDLIQKGIKVVGAHDCHPPAYPAEHVRWSGREMSELVLNYIARGQLRVDDLITHRFKPDQCAEAYAMLNTHRATAMGVMFEW